MPNTAETARLLVVDDEPNIRAPLARALSLQGYVVEEAGSGLEALMLLKNSLYNLMVLDMRMPGVDGVEVMHRARELQPELLIIILTGHASVDNAIAAIRSEAVDYLLKPASTHQILKAITEALQNHSQKFSRRSLVNMMGNTLDTLGQRFPPSRSGFRENPRRIIRAAPLILDRETHQVAVTGEFPTLIDLTASETAILASLIARPGEVLSCRDLAEAAWGNSMKEEEAQVLIRPHISRLRRKLETDPKKPCLIHTVRRRGYYFDPMER